MKKRCLFFSVFILLYCLLGTTTIIAQPFYKYTDTLKVYNGAHQLKYPFAGGLNNAQFSAINLNQDTVPDLFVFDRSGNKILCFINQGIHDSVCYKYYPEAENWFPKNLTNWVLIRDMNCDGEGDLLTQSGAYLYLYLAHRNTDGTLSYQLKNFFQHGVGYVPFVNYFIPGGTSGNLYATAADIALIDDLDNDGDLDILTFDQTSMIWEYKNLQAEDGVSCTDSMRFQNTSWCWGYLQDNYVREVSLGISCSVPRLGGAKHSGNTLAAIDIDKDGDIDIVKGNISWSNLSMLYNQPQNGMDSIYLQDTLFPSNNHPYRTDQFAAPFIVDVNNDKQPDLLVSPNAQYFSENKNCVSFYKNTGIGGLQPFQFESDSFLVSDMIDAGEGNYPAFFDYNNDSLPDIIMGNNGTYDTSSHSFIARLFLYKNTGTKNHAQFNLISADWLHLSTLHQRMLAPCFGDLDNDGLPDMLLGNDSGKIIYFKNMGWAASPQFVLQNYYYQNINVGSSCTPQLIDLNQDNLPDLVCGKQDGRLTYYQNTGTATNAIFTKQTDSLGRVNVIENGDLWGYSAPYFLHFSPTAPLSLLVGNKYGHVFQYENISNNFSGTFMLQSNNFSNINCGERAAPTASQLMGNDSVEIVCGAYRGGVQLYTNGGIGIPNSISSLPIKNEQLILYPNPVRTELTIHNEQSAIKTIEVRNMLGQMVICPLLFANSTDYFKLNTEHLPSGIYFIKVTDIKGYQQTAKFVKE